jgi:Ca-activated chloride channel homolog
MRYLLSVTLAAGLASVQFKVDVQLVRLLVNVKNPAGDLVGSLDQKEFTVHDNGVPQDIAVFERYTTQPLSVALLVDTSGSTATNLRNETNSISRFLRALFREGNEKDSAALYAFSADVTQLSSFTRRQKRLEDQLKLIHPEGGTSLYDAVHFAARDLIDRDGRHVIVVVTDGGDTMSSSKFNDALESAQRANAVMYPIVVIPITNDAGRNLGGEHALQTFAASTGGRWFDPTVGEQLDQVFSDILRDLRSQYMIGYYPRGLPRDTPRFHTVHVQLKRPDLRAFTRTGYYEGASR